MVFCVMLIISRRSLITKFAYSLNGVVLPRADSIKDLGVIFDKKFSFTENFDAIYAKANRLLGFIFRATREFPDHRSFIHLYKSLVVTIIVCASPI